MKGWPFELMGLVEPHGPPGDGDKGGGVPL